LILSIAVMAGLSNSYESTLKLLCVVAGAMALFYAGLKSDLSKPSSRRHLYGTLIGAAALIVGGLHVRILALPGLGALEVGSLLGVIFTIGWVFLLVSMLELCALVPLVAGGVALFIGAGVFMPLDVFENYEGLTLAGALMGGVLGRSIAVLVMTRSHPLEKSETLVLGYIIASMTLATYMKSFTLTGFILPLGIIVIGMVLLLTRSFDSSLILRPRPRE
jgi:hypothetical protein